MTQPGDDGMDALLLRHPAFESCAAEIEKASDALIAAYDRGGKLLLCGNGGSAADCEHIAGELLKGFERARPLPPDLRAKLGREGRDGERLAASLQRALPAVSLTGHPSFASAWANDVDAELGFAQLVTALGEQGDVLLAISTSGQARNVQLAARAARAMDITVIGLTGMDGGALAPLCDICIIAPARTTAEVQELHLPVYHYLCRAVEAHFFPD